MTILVIASAYRSNLSAQENMLRHVQAFKKVNKYALALPHEAVGYYQEEGQTTPNMEQSWVFPIRDTDLAIVHDLFCKTLEQDSIMLINPNTMDAGLFNKDYTSLELGKFQSITKHKAEESVAWTFFKGHYWAAL